MTTQLDNINFRKAKVEDAIYIRELVKQLGYDMALEDVRDSIENIINDDNRYICVAETKNGQVVGYAHIGEAKLAYIKYGAEFHELCVESKYRAKGIGKKLIEMVQEWAKAKGCLFIMGRSNAIRTKSHEFYKHVGFDIIKKQCVIYMDL